MSDKPERRCVVPQCFECKHFEGLTETGYKCAAFPVDIPQAILLGGDHTKPFPGDHGIRFEPIETK